MSEADLVREVYAGSYHRLVGQLFGICGDLPSAEEVVQEAFVRAITHRRSFRGADNPEAWLRRVALNVYRNRWRRRQIHARLEPRFPRAEPTLDLSPDHAALVAALRRLPVDQREAIVLYHVADLPVREVAATLGVPEGTVKARLSRGRAALALLLRDSDEERHA